MSERTELSIQAQAPVEMERHQAPVLLRPVAAIESILESQNDVAEVVAKALQQDRDYGIIPNTKKPTLLKPGAERICNAFGVYGDFDVLEREVDHTLRFDWEKAKKVWNNAYQGDNSFKMEKEPGESVGLYRYVVKCRLILRTTGECVGTGLGSCSSMESKYIDRPRDIENTVLKMAKKRAFVDGCLNTFGLSDRFTQDMEDQAPKTQAKPKKTSAPTEAANYLKKELGMTDAEYHDFIGMHPNGEWATVALESKAGGLKDKGPLLDPVLAKDPGQKPPPVDEYDPFEDE